MLSTNHRVVAIIVLILGLFMLSQHLRAQNVVLEGKTFVQQTSSGDSTATGYYYQDKEGVKHPIFLSAYGKAYCWVKSKKTGKLYKRYLPKITEAFEQKNKGRD